jgi:hypothetical protein
MRSIEHGTVARRSESLCLALHPAAPYRVVSLPSRRSFGLRIRHRPVQSLATAPENGRRQPATLAVFVHQNFGRGADAAIALSLPMARRLPDLRGFICYLG